MSGGAWGGNGGLAVAVVQGEGCPFGQRRRGAVVHPVSVRVGVGISDCRRMLL